MIRKVKVGGRLRRLFEEAVKEAVEVTVKGTVEAVRGGPFEAVKEVV